MLLVPGITISADPHKAAGVIVWSLHFTRNNSFCFYRKIEQLILNGTFQFVRLIQSFQTLSITSGGDNSLHINSSFLQKVERQAADRTQCSHAGLARHHGDGGRLDGPDARHRLVIWPHRRTPGNIMKVIKRSRTNMHNSSVSWHENVLET